MARTIYGNLTGRAARTFDSLPEYSPKIELGHLMHRLRALDPRWETWYDAEVTDGDWQHIIAQVRPRITALLSSQSQEVRRIRNQIDEIYTSGRFWDSDSWNSNPEDVRAEMLVLGTAALEIESDGGYYCDHCRSVYHDANCPDCERRDREDFRP